MENHRPGPVGRTKPGGQRGETPNDTHYKTRSPKEMRKSCGLRMLLKLQATPMLSFSSELKNKEKQKVSFGGPGRPAGRPAGDPQNFIFSASPWGTRRPTRPHTASHARTHATQPQPKPKSISRLATPPNLQS